MTALAARWWLRLGYMLYPRKQGDDEATYHGVTTPPTHTHSGAPHDPALANIITVNYTSITLVDTYMCAPVNITVQVNNFMKHLYSSKQLLQLIVTHVHYPNCFHLNK